MLEITLAVVAYNEEKYLPKLLSDLKKQNYPHELIEIVFVDSASTDSTKSIMEQFASESDFKNVVICDNPKKRLACGCNVAISAFNTDALVRVDAHARIPEDFILECVRALEGYKGPVDETRETAASDMISPEYAAGGVRPTACETTDGWSKTLLMAEDSMFGSSISRARRTGGEGEYVDSIFHVALRREVLEKCGGFREDLGRTEDNEFYYRLRKNGYKIYKSPYIYSEQYIRPTLRKMLKQKAGNGYWVGRTLGIVPGCISIYHLVPCAFVLTIAGVSVLAVLGHPWLMRLLAGLYGSVSVLMALFAVFGMQRENKKVSITAVALPVIFFMLHVVYGAGSILGLCSIPFGRSLRPKKRG